MNRTEWLRALLVIDRPLGEIVSALAGFGWDSDEKLVVLNAEHFVSVGKRYLLGEINANEVTSWANAIECREDIAFDEEHEEMVREVLHELANPYLTQELSPDRAKELIGWLSPKKENGATST